MTTLTLRQRAEGTLWGLFLGDALAMPVHWYCDRAAPGAFRCGSAE